MGSEFASQGREQGGAEFSEVRGTLAQSLVAQGTDCRENDSWREEEVAAAAAAEVLRRRV